MRTSLTKMTDTEVILSGLLETLCCSTGSIHPEDLRSKIALALFNVSSVVCDLDDFKTDSTSDRLYPAQKLV